MEEQRLNAFWGGALCGSLGEGVWGGLLRKRRLITRKMNALFVQGLSLTLINNFTECTMLDYLSYFA